MELPKKLISKSENELLKIVVPMSTYKYSYLLVTQRMYCNGGYAGAKSGKE